MGSGQLTASGPQKVAFIPIPSFVVNPIHIYSFARIKALWTIQHLQLLHKLSFNITHEICTYLADLEVPIAVHSSNVQYFDLDSRLWGKVTTLREMIDVDYTSAVTFVREGRIFVCGGLNHRKFGHTTRSSYLLESSGNVHKLPQMLIPRAHHGIVYDECNDVVYVFGCEMYRQVDNRQRSIEKFLFSAKRWVRLAQMHMGRMRFNPCLFKSIVYLCGGYTQRIETYDTISDKCTLLTDFLIEKWNYPCLAVRESDVLILVTEFCTYTWNLSTNYYACASHSEFKPWSRCTPVVSQGVVFIVAADDSCLCIRVSTGNVEKQVRKDNSLTDYIV